MCIIWGRGASSWTRAWLGMGLLVLGSGGSATAGAYLYPAGQGQVIVTAMFTQAWRQFDTNGKFVPTRRFRQIQASAYLEYGLVDRLTLIVKPSITRANFASGGSMVTAGSTGSEIGARLLLGHWRGLTLAAEANGVLPSPRLGHHTALLADADGGGELRGIAGLSFGLGAWPVFAEAGFGYRWHAGAPPGEWRSEATLGARPLPKILLMLQFFDITSDGKGALPFGRFRQDKLQASIVYDFDAAWSLQLGAVTTLAGVDTPAEQGALAAVWRRF